MTKDEIKYKIVSMAPGLSRACSVDYRRGYDACIENMAEALANGAVAMVGLKNDEWSFDETATPQDTHSAIAICIEPMQRAVPLDEIRGYINNPSAWNSRFDQRVSDLLERIVKYGVKQ